MSGYFCFVPWRKFVLEQAEGPEEAYEPEQPEGWLVHSRMTSSSTTARLPISPSMKSDFASYPFVSCPLGGIEIEVRRLRIHIMMP